MSFQLPQGLRPAQPPSGGSGSGGGGGRGSPGAGPSQAGSGGGGGDQAEAAERQRQNEEMKRGMIASMLAPEARERLSRIALTRPEMTSRVEDLLIRMGQAGQIRGQVTDEALKGLLQQVSEASAPKPAQVAPKAGTKTLAKGITIQRKRDDSDSDEYDL